MLGHNHPWVAPLGMSHLDFLGPIELLKNHKKHLNKYFHNFVMNTLLGSINFETSIISRILCILMFIIIAFIKSFKKLTLIPFLELLIKNTNLKHDLKILLGILFLR
jgi:hypothetical protein